MINTIRYSNSSLTKEIHNDSVFPIGRALNKINCSNFSLSLFLTRAIVLNTSKFPFQINQLIYSKCLRYGWLTKVDVIFLPTFCNYVGFWILYPYHSQWAKPSSTAQQFSSQSCLRNHKHLFLLSLLSHVLRINFGGWRFERKTGKLGLCFLTLADWHHAAIQTQQHRRRCHLRVVRAISCERCMSSTFPSQES